MGCQRFTSRTASIVLAAALSGGAALVLLCGEGARAHSFWPNYYSAKTAVSVDGERMGVMVTVEVPVVFLIEQFRQHFSDLDLEKEIREGRFASLEDEFRDHELGVIAAALELEIDGRETVGSWRPVDTPVNGRANEGFFVYLVEFRPLEPLVLGTTVEVEISNRVYEGESIVFANYVQARGGWKVAESSTPQPPPGADLSLGSPDEIAMWSEEPGRRRFRVVLRRVDRD